jgi:hypothetical protein
MQGFAEAAADVEETGSSSPASSSLQPPSDRSNPPLIAHTVAVAKFLHAAALGKGVQKNRETQIRCRIHRRRRREVGVGVVEVAASTSVAADFDKVGKARSVKARRW